MPFVSKLQIQESGFTQWELISPVRYQGKYQQFLIQSGYVTDFATIPRILRWLINTYGPYTKAAILHDWLLTDLIPARSVTSYDADHMFKRVMREEGVSFPLRWLMWAGVRWGALVNPRRAYGRDFKKDAPKVIGISLLALPFILPGVLGISVPLALVWGYTKAIRR
jgi:hypothetical protein